MNKKWLNINVLEAAKERIKYIFDEFECIYISFSGGKDSTVMLHLVMDECIKRNKKIGLLFIDWEAQYKYTIEHIKKCLELYKEYIDIYWVALPLKTTNSVSQFEPEWICWERGKEDIWVRELPNNCISAYNFFDFYHYGMLFEEFIFEFGKWYQKRQAGNNEYTNIHTACLIGIRTDESFNRLLKLRVEKYRTFYKKKKWILKQKSTQRNIFSVHPIYDWKTKDVWTYTGKYDKIYNKLYDRMHQAGVKLSQQRICEPYGDEQKKGLWLFHIIEPETWGKIVSRVNGANSGALYAKENGSITGRIKITKPENHTWESFARFLLNSMPTATREHYENKILIYINYCNSQNIPIPYFQDKDTGTKDIPSWRRICKCLLKNDYWCYMLSFSANRSELIDKYLKMMRRRKQTQRFQQLKKRHQL